MAIKLLSLNVRGLRNHVKRCAIFNYCRSRADIILLQETHSCPTTENRWQLEWGGSILFSHGDTNARGVCILVKRGASVMIVQNSIEKDSGRKTCPVLY